MNTSLVDVPVALIFFNRPDTFAKVFEAVANARPSKLFLIQDGPRDGREDDIENVRKCREVINIDWECEVHQDYSDINLGCGKRVYSGLNNAFSVVDRLVIIEDDVIISEDMLPFCAELLEKYKDDERIFSISCMNMLGQYNKCPYSYLFTTSGGGISGWATWKRIWDEVDFNIGCVEDKYAMDALKLYKAPRLDGDYWVKLARNAHNAVKSGKKMSAWSYALLMSSVFVQNRMAIVTTKNLIVNIGLVGANSDNELHTVPRGIRCLYTLEHKKINWPLKHPKYVVDDYDFSRKMQKIMGRGIFTTYFRAIERRVYKAFPFLGK